MGAGQLYENRKLSEAYPGLGSLDADDTARFAHAPMIGVSILETMECLRRITDLPPGNNKVSVVGCGPQAASLVTLLSMGFDATGVEPVPHYAEDARKVVGDERRVLAGSAEELPYADESLAVVIMESVLEHVDSPSRSLAETYRVLAPGGIAFIGTTNRLRLSPAGDGEYKLPFFQFYPRLLKEAFVHHHLHYRPSLANYTTRPAVHWFSYSDLCARGREAGFYRFYSRFDAMRVSDPSVARSRLRRAMITFIQRNPIARALALSQFGGAIFMLKRKSADQDESGFGSRPTSTAASVAPARQPMTPVGARTVTK